MRVLAFLLMTLSLCGCERIVYGKYSDRTEAVFRAVLAGNKKELQRNTSNTEVVRYLELVASRQKDLLTAAANDLQVSTAERRGEQLLTIMVFRDNGIRETVKVVFDMSHSTLTVSYVEFTRLELEASGTP